MNKPRLNCQFKKRTLNVDFVNKDLSKQMHLFIPIIEVVTKRTILNRILNKQKWIKMKDSDQSERDR